MEGVEHDARPCRHENCDAVKVMRRFVVGLHQAIQSATRITQWDNHRRCAIQVQFLAEWRFVADTVFQNRRVNTVRKADGVQEWSESVCDILVLV